MKNLIVPMAVAALSFSSVFADDLKLVNGDFSLGLEGEMNINYLDSDQAESVQNFEDSHVTLTASWNEKIRAVVRTRLQELFVENEIDFTDDFDLENFIEEAFIEIKNIGGMPVAVVVGKRPIAFGQNVEAMPIYTQSALYGINEIKDVMGVTIALEEGLFGLVDSAELTLFENEAGDLDIGDVKGLSVKVTKDLTENIKMTLSHVSTEESADGAEDEDRRTSLGFIASTDDGTLVGWAEGTLLSNNPEYPNASYAITVGASKQVTESTSIIVEYNHIEDQIHEYGIGAMMNLTKGLSVGTEVRYRDNRDITDDEVIFGLTAKYALGANLENDEYLFGDN